MKYLTDLLIIILWDISAGAVSLPVSKPAAINYHAAQHISSIPIQSMNPLLSLKTRDLGLIVAIVLTIGSVPR